MKGTDIALKRSILLSARLRFSPQTQPIKENAIDKITEQLLLAADSEDGLTIADIQDLSTLCFLNGSPTLRAVDIEASLHRLFGRQRVLLTRVGSPHCYRLSRPIFDELEQARKIAEDRLQRTLSKLYSNTKLGPTRHARAFLECLCCIFSSLGESYVRMLKGDIAQKQFVSSPDLLQAINRAIAKYPEVDSESFQSGIFHFFEESEPDFDQIKWNLAQNYFVAQVLGIDPTGRLLSKELFGGAVFYLDTNVLIQALEPSARHHRSFKSLSKACSGLQISLNVCQISLYELSKVANYQRDLLEKVKDQIPDETSSKVRGIFYQLYRDSVRNYGTVDLDEIFSSFLDPMPLLKETYDVHLVDDKWFLETQESKETKTFADQIRTEYSARRKRPKSLGSALHDACILRWVQFERDTSAENAWLITLDSSLPYCAPRTNGAPMAPLAITLPAFLQWISPIAVLDEIEDEMATIFSEAMKYQLLPQDSFFDLRDFLVFSEMAMACKELPAKDVEDCIRYVRSKAPTLDPSRPEDREKLAHEISKFMADPTRRHKQEIVALEAKVDQITREAVQMNDDLKAIIQGQDEVMADLRARLASLQTSLLRKSAQVRMGFVLFAYVVAESTTLYFTALRYQRHEWLERIIHLSLIHGVEFTGAVILAAFVLGRERIRSLGWPFTKFFKAD